ncbi:uncharacterized protein KY384_008016 [Bacidia gigantensis]|uniref:uncharacterized protein n=1 Tax=Bacidia gigantensis TaxID=2732470 RepID=UPI001D03C7CE|nr:uncharacterized protein KY384_008016 [Bacidia gigantensis]KAG8527272.1 hypothetical protein KY384_008016 [Bacidia gigantensis]
MTSYKRQSGNTYNGHCSPKYNALSYTWGRWALKNHEMHEVTAIPVKGTTWPIPRINPAHFTSEDFHNVIADTVDPHPSDVEAPRVDFLWLDVACIHQNTGSPEQAEEIGRQAKIFGGASRVFIRLTTFTLDAINRWAVKMDLQFSIMVDPDFYTKADLSLWVSSMRDLVEAVLADPWFSSLWTLQETYLSPNAYVISRDANKRSFDPWLLNHLSETFNIVAGAIDHNEEIHQLSKDSGLSMMITRSGLLELFNKHLMGLLTVSSNRTTTRREDRIYGIMQIFNLQLGASASDADPRRNFTLSELSDQLGMTLLQKYPIQSQLHIFNGPVALGKGWRINETSTIPDKCRQFYHPKRLQQDIHPTAVLSTHNLNNDIWGIFEGRTIPFRLFARQLLRDWPNTWELGNATVQLDYSLIPHCWLTQDRPDLKILLLGIQILSAANDEAREGWAVGMLLNPTTRPTRSEPSGPVRWTRVGLTIWSINDTRPKIESVGKGHLWAGLKEHISGEKESVTKRLDYLVGEGLVWKIESGLYG